MMSDPAKRARTTNSYLVELRLRDGKLTAVREVLRSSSSYFAQLLDEEGSSTRDEAGAYFVSADAAPMRAVLKYLETGKLSYDASIKADLIDLADMLCLDKLLVEVQGGFNPFALRADVVSEREAESEWHRRLANKDDHASTENAASEADADLLIDVAARKADFRFSAEPLGTELPLLFENAHRPLAPGAPTIDVDLFPEWPADAGATFKRALFNFAKQTPASEPSGAGVNFLEGLDLTNVVVAGGAVLRVLLGKTQPTMDTDAEHQSDIDLFLVGLADEELMRAKVQEIFEALKAQVTAEAAVAGAGIRFSRGELLVVRSTSAISFVLPAPRRTVQVMLTRYSCVSDVLLNFDFDACQVCARSVSAPCCGRTPPIASRNAHALECASQVAWDGTRVLCTPGARRAINHRIILADPTVRHKGFESRLQKYAARGFGVTVPGLDFKRIDGQLLKGSYANYSGQLCRYEFIVERTVAEIYGRRSPTDDGAKLHKLYALGAAVEDLPKLIVLSAIHAAGFQKDYQGGYFMPHRRPEALAAPLDDPWAGEGVSLFLRHPPPGYVTLPLDRLRGLVGVRELETSNHGVIYTDPQTKELRPLLMDAESASAGLGTLLVGGRPKKSADNLRYAYRVGRVPPVVWDVIDCCPPIPPPNPPMPPNAWVPNNPEAQQRLREMHYVPDAAYVPDGNDGVMGQQWNRERAAAAFKQFYEGKLPRYPLFPCSHEADFLQRPTKDWFAGVHGGGA